MFYIFMSVTYMDINLLKGNLFNSSNSLKAFGIRLQLAENLYHGR